MKIGTRFRLAAWHGSPEGPMIVGLVEWREKTATGSRVLHVVRGEMPFKNDRKGNIQAAGWCYAYNVEANRHLAPR